MIEVSVAKKATAWTFNAWGQLNSFDGWKNIYDQQHSGQRITISVSSNKFMLYDTDYRQSDNSFDLEDDSGWHMYTVSQSGNTLSFYVDGQLQNTEPSAGHAIGGVDAHIGRFFPIKFGIIEEWDGGLDQISIWERALNEDEVSVIYNSGYGIDVSQNIGAYQSASELMAYWPLNENSGTVIQDSSNNTNYGLIQNSTWSSRTIFQSRNFEKISSDGSGKNWVAEYQFRDGDVVDGAMEFQISRFPGHRRECTAFTIHFDRGITKKSVAVDTSSPRVLTTSIASTNTNIDPSLGANTLLAKRGHDHRQFTTDERVKDPTATINENMVEVRPQSDDDSGKKWEFEYDVVDGINVDQTSFQITGAFDSHGNALVAFPEATTDNASKFVRIDTKRPEINNVTLATSNSNTERNLNKLATARDNITLSFTATEDIKIPQILLPVKPLRPPRSMGLSMNGN